MNHFEIKLEAYIAKRLPDGRPAGRGQKEWRAECPFCQNEDKKFYVGLSSGVSQCFHCGFKASDHISLVAALERLSGRVEAERWWNEKSTFTGLLTLRPIKHTRQKHMVQALPAEFRPLGDLQNWYSHYLTEIRKITTQEIVHYQIGFCETGYYHLRIIIPVVNDDVLEFFTDRTIDPEEEQKTWGVGTGQEAWPIDKSTVIFNIAQAAQHKHIYVVEGALDAISTGMNACALLGKECSNTQLRRLRNAVQPGGAIVVGLDVDAIKKTADLCERLLKWGLDVWWLPLKLGDPNWHRQHHIPLPTPLPWDFITRMRAREEGLVYEKRLDGDRPRSRRSDRSHN